MITSILRSVGAVLLSLIVAVLLLIAVEGVSAVLHPFPDDFGGSGQEVAQHVANYPTWVLALLGGGGWALTAFASTWLVTRIGAHRHQGHGYGVGVLLLAAAIFNMAMLPYPAWFWVLTLVVIPVAIYFGTALGKGNSGAATATNQT